MSSPLPATARVNAHPAGSAGDANARELAALNELARIATLDLELRPMVQRITDALASHFGYELVALVMTNPDGAAFTCQALTTSLQTEVHIGYTRPLGTGVVGEVAATQHAVLIDDVRVHTNFVDTTPGVLSEICVPIRHNETLVGVLNIESTLS
jgi:GAF domain-containing protein